MLILCILIYNIIEYWWDGSASTAILPTSASDVLGQHNNYFIYLLKNEDITFWVAHVYYLFYKYYMLIFFIFIYV